MLNKWLILQVTMHLKQNIILNYKNKQFFQMLQSHTFSYPKDNIFKIKKP